MSSSFEQSQLHYGSSQPEVETEPETAPPMSPPVADPDPQLPHSNDTDVRLNEAENYPDAEPANTEAKDSSDAKLVNDETEDSRDVQPINAEAEDAGDAKPVNDEKNPRDARTINDEAEVSRDIEPVNGEPDSSHVAQPVNNEVSNSAREEEITKELSSADVRVEQSNQEGDSGSKLGNPEGNRTFTMRELLSNLPNGDANENDERDIDTPHSQAISEQQMEPDNAAMDLINSVSVADEEGRSRQRILMFAAKRYATALERNPRDYDALYNWALVLQESADNVNPESSSPSKDALLEEACRKYEEAVRLCPTLNDAYYNLAIAISDRAKMRGRTKEAEELWKQATKNYEKAVQLNWNSPQALNNWGLALQELSGIVPAREKQQIVKTAIGKFRAAIQLQFDFHRAIYNLGTVLYGLAEDISRTGGYVNTKDISPDELYSQSAVYIAAAHALKPSYSVYSSALKLVRSMLPLPYLKVGYLTAPPSGNFVAPHSDWKPSQFVLSHEGLQQITNVDQRLSSPSLLSNASDTPASNPAIRVDVHDIVSASPCADLTLPPGAGLCIDTIHGPVYLVADSWESLDRWIDAIRLVYTIYARGKRDVLAGIIAS